MTFWTSLGVFVFCSNLLKVSVQRQEQVVAGQVKQKAGLLELLIPRSRDFWVLVFFSVLRGCDFFFWCHLHRLFHGLEWLSKCGYLSGCLEHLSAWCFFIQRSTSLYGFKVHRKGAVTPALVSMIRFGTIPSSSVFFFAGNWHTRLAESYQVSFWPLHSTVNISCSHLNGQHMCDRVDQLPIFPYNRGWSSTQ